MLQWFKGVYSEFTPRALKVSISALAAVGFGVYVLATSTSIPAPVVVGKSSSAKTTVSTAKIFVHIAGKVRKPGIYQLDSGARVYDLVLLAGGFSAKANQASVNLARVLTDGEQVIITDRNSLAQGSQSNLISLNQASSSALEDLPGVGPALAARIVDWREANGGFKSKEDLLNVAGIGDKLFASVKELVTL